MNLKSDEKNRKVEPLQDRFQAHRENSGVLIFIVSPLLGAVGDHCPAVSCDLLDE